METEWTTDAVNDVTLVTVVVRNPAPVARRVRVTNRLDGPVLPPRRAGVPERGWDRDGFAGTIPAEGRRSLGYACPGSPTTPPVAVTDGGPVGDNPTEGNRGADGGTTPTAAAAVRQLGDPRPPTDAVPAGTGPDGGGSDGAADDRAIRETDADLPPPVAAWLSTVEGRIERGERLTGASVATATEILETCDDAAALDDRVATDADALGRVSERAATLADRAAAVEVPVAALRRLA